MNRDTLSLEVSTEQCEVSDGPFLVGGVTYVYATIN